MLSLKIVAPKAIWQDATFVYWRGRIVAPKAFTRLLLHLHTSPLHYYWSSSIKLDPPSWIWEPKYPLQYKTKARPPPSRLQLNQFVGYCAESSWAAMDLQGGGNYVFAEIPARFLFFEHVCDRSLGKFISDESSGLEWNMGYEIVKGICGGLSYVHDECHIGHPDLKPENILMDATMMPKIADFGSSRIFSDKQPQIITQNCL